MYFDGASSKEEGGDGVIFFSSTNEEFSLSIKISFETTNNVVEYEALILGLGVSKKDGNYSTHYFCPKIGRTRRGL